ncbi:MAG: M64 family metallopeptidase [Planctomycetota bacterium]
MFRRQFAPRIRVGLWLAAAVLAFPAAAAGQVRADAGPPSDTVYFDYLDEAGTLRGGRVDILVTPWKGVKTMPARWFSDILRDGPVGNRIDLVTVGDGYLQTQLPLYHNHVNAALGTMFDVEPFKTYANYFNRHVVDVVSNQAGVDHDPTYPIWRDTALDMGFWCNNMERLLCVDVGKAYTFAQNAPDVDMVLAVANSTKYGGAGYSSANLATVSGGNGSAAEVALHEFGHSLGDLADEYDYGGGTVYSGPEPTERNVSKLTSTQMAASGTKWARWLNFFHSGYDGLISTYEGAYYYQRGIYRPTNNSRMRALNRPFNLPCAEGLVIEIYKIVDPIDDSTPTGQTLTGQEVVFVTPLEPIGHALDIQWTLDGQPLAGATQATLDLRALRLLPGDYVLGVTVVDNTWFVRDEPARAQWLTERRTWNVHVVIYPGDLDCNRLIDFNDINPFVLALTDPQAYQAHYPSCPLQNGDVNGDGQVNFGDVNPFVALLSGS